MSLCAITCVFNPCEYRSKLANFEIFRAGLERQRVPLFVIEAARGSDTWSIAESVRVRAHDIMFQKERLLNRLMDRLPSMCDQVAWLDADVLFRNDGWLESASRLLQAYQVVQLYDRAEQLTKSGAMFTRSLGGVSHKGGPFGYGWAARRELLEKHGFYDRAIIGGGASIMGSAFLGQRYDFLNKFSPAHAADVAQWSAAVYTDVKGQVGVVPGIVSHLWHGEIVSRQYAERHLILQRHGFDPAADIAIDDQGCWKWTSDKPEMHREVREYFFQRNEDQNGVAP